jgi:molybdopterin-guanine dinucleotide biosynthesis protein A
VSGPSIAAVVLVGGRARRMGGIAKPLVSLGGVSLWERSRAALAAVGAAPVVGVGPRLEDEAGVRAAADRPGAAGRDAEVVWVREDPPFGGPVAGIAAALARGELAGAEWLLLLAGDLVRPEAVVSRLGDAVRGTGIASEAEGADGIVFRADGQPQWLAGIYRTARVRGALASLGAPEGASCRVLLGGLAIRWIPDEDGITADIDTPEDLERARARAGPDPSADPIHPTPRSTHGR